jgi:hypothetical protein
MTRAGQLDLSRLNRHQRYWDADGILALRGGRLDKVLAAQREDGLWVKTVRVGGKQRTVAPAGMNAENLCVLVGALRKLPR